MKIYNSSLDGFAKVGSVTLLTLSVGFMALGVYPFLNHYSSNSHLSFIAYLKLLNAETIGIAFITPVVLWLLTAFTYRNRMVGVTLTDKAILINGPRKPKIILLSEIATATQPTTAELMNARYTGSRIKNSVWGFIGTFYNKANGYMQWYCTQKKNYILLTTTAKTKIVLTVDNPTEFMKDLHAVKPDLQLV
jgi:hypothetical protein